jgi:hypothetical protein
MDGSTQKTNQQVISSQYLEHHKSEVQLDQIQSSSALWLAKLGNFLITIFRQSDEIQVWQRCDRNGQLWWYAYNPKTQRIGAFESELAIQVWIEQQQRL